MPLQRANTMPKKSSPPVQASSEILPEDLLSGLSLSKSAVVKSRNRAMTATDFENILCQL